MATALYRKIMQITSNHPLPHGGISPNGPISPARPASPVPEVTGQVVHQTTGAIHTTGPKLTPIPVFNHWANVTRNGIARYMTLRERRTRTKQRVGKEHSEDESLSDDAIDPVAGRVRTADVSLALNLLFDKSGDDQRSRLEEELKARKLNPMQRVHVYMKAATNVEQAGLSREDAQRVKEALKKSAQDLQSQNRHELRRAMHDPEKLREAIEMIAGPLEKLTESMRRDLLAVADVQRPQTQDARREARTLAGTNRPRIAIPNIDVPAQGLWLVKLGNLLAGPQHCLKWLAVCRSLWRSGY